MTLAIILFAIAITVIVGLRPLPVPEASAGITICKHSELSLAGQVRE